MNETEIVKNIIEVREDTADIRATMATKDDMTEIKDMLENIVTVAKRIQEDQLFSIEWIKRLQDKVDKQDEQIHQIKLHLKLA